jgi:hypothetical protein
MIASPLSPRHAGIETRLLRRLPEALEWPAAHRAMDDPAVPAARGGHFVSIHAAFGRCPLQIPETDPQELRRGDQQKRFALSHGQSEPDQGASHPDHGSTRHRTEVRPFTASESLTGDLEAFLDEPPNRGVGSVRLVLAHPECGEFVNHSAVPRSLQIVP